MKSGNLLFVYLIPVLILLIGCSRQDEEESIPEIKTKMDTISYVLGADIAQSLIEQKVDINIEVLKRGLEEAYFSPDALFTKEERQQIIEEYNKKLQARYEEKKLYFAKQRKEKEDKFLEENKKNESVFTLENGLQIQTIVEGRGRKPKPDDSVFVHYKLSLSDGTIIDDSHNRKPETFRLNKVIAGLSQSIQQMRVWGTYKIYIPEHLGYGLQDKEFKNGKVIIPAGSTLIYDIELLRIYRKYIPPVQDTVVIVQDTISEDSDSADIHANQEMK